MSRKTHTRKHLQSRNAHQSLWVYASSSNSSHKLTPAKYLLVWITYSATFRCRRCPVRSHSQEFTLILPFWLCLPKKHIAWPLAATAYYAQLSEQNAQSGLNLHHHSITRYPGICVAKNVMTLQNTQTGLHSSAQTFTVWYMEYGEPMWFEVDIN